MKNIEIKIAIKDIVSSMTYTQRVVYQKNSKKLSIYLLLTLFLGGFGAQFFYREKCLYGVISLFFFWTFIPAIIAFICLFTCDKDINNFNYSTLRGSNF